MVVWREFPPPFLWWLWGSRRRRLHCVRSRLNHGPASGAVQDQRPGGKGRQGGSPACTPVVVAGPSYSSADGVVCVQAAELESRTQALRDEIEQLKQVLT